MNKCNLSIDPKKVLWLRLTYFLTSCIILGILIVIYKIVYCDFSRILQFKPLCKLFIFSLITVETLSLVDDWFGDKKVGLKIANFLRLWPGKSNDDPLAEIAKKYIWEGHFVIEVFLFVVLSVITLLTW